MQNHSIMRQCCASVIMKYCQNHQNLIIFKMMSRKYQLSEMSMEATLLRLNLASVVKIS